MVTTSWRCGVLWVYRYGGGFCGPSWILTRAMEVGWGADIKEDSLSCCNCTLLWGRLTRLVTCSRVIWMDYRYVGLKGGAGVLSRYFSLEPFPRNAYFSL
jgi:hypothetical protein